MWKSGAIVLGLQISGDAGLSHKLHMRGRSGLWLLDQSIIEKVAS